METKRHGISSRFVITLVLTSIFFGWALAVSAETSGPRTFCRFVPERSDDFAWENDLIAFRAYGPALRKGTENSGIDCWLKRVKTPIIDTWYKQAQEGKTYHKDWGEGLDNYHVGSSAGCGGTGIWLNEKREPLETFVRYEVIRCTPECSQFKFFYEREIDGMKYGEEKTITIKPGERLFDVHSVFTKDGEPAPALPVCIGVTTHNGKAAASFDKEKGWIAAWETLDDSELGTAAMADPERIDEIKVVQSEKPDESHIFILIKTDENGAVDYKAGYGWKKAGEIKTQEDWSAYLSAYAGSKQISRFEIEEVISIAKVPASFPVNFCLLTEGDRQYVAYYDKARNMTVASRLIGTDQWQYKVLPSKVGWDSHNYITLALDKAGHLHVSGNMHANPLVYFRTEIPYDIQTLEKRDMTGELENRATYPKFLTDHDGNLLFTYRHGGSGNGINLYNAYNVQKRRWTRFLDTPLFDGEGQCNAYPLGPIRGPDGWFHVVWVWRDTPDCATTHHLSHARSRDLLRWESVFGDQTALPLILSETKLWVDPVPIHGGLINSSQKLNFDSQNRPFITYHKADTNGNMQIYCARPEADRWTIHQLTDWDKPVEFSGRGSMGFIGIKIEDVKLENGLFTIQYLHKDYGRGCLGIEESSLSSVAQVPSVVPDFPPEMNRVQSNFPGMTINRFTDLGDSGDEQTRYLLQWETLGRNRDKPRKPPLPPPAMLKLYKLKFTGK